MLALVIKNLYFIKTHVITTPKQVYNYNIVSVTYQEGCFSNPHSEIFDTL